MSYFQLPGGTRLYTDHEKRSERITIHKGNEIDLEHVSYPDAKGKIPEIRLSKDSKAGVVDLQFHNSGKQPPSLNTTRRFTVKALGAGTVTIQGQDGAGNSIGSPLKVVAGDFDYHTGMSTDLLAEIGRRSDANLNYQLQRVLLNDYENLFNQANDPNASKFKTPLACGMVAKAGGKSLIGNVASHNYEKDSSYHRPLSRITGRNDVRYDANSMVRIRGIIAKYLKKGSAVLVGTVYDPKTSMLKQGHMQATSDGGHSVLIVGCNDKATEFLYVDPFPGGSVLKYEGGMKHEPYPRHCMYMGMFVVDTSQGRGPILRQRPEKIDHQWSGNRYLEVISGPTF